MDRDLNVRTLDLSWIRGKTDDWRKTIEEVELIAAEMLAKDESDESLDWARRYLSHAGTIPHGGDCGLCRSWDTAPITCGACVYDEYMLRAWAKKRREYEHTP